MRGINTFRGIGNSEEAAYSCAALSLASVKRVPSTKRASQKGRGKSLKRWRPDCKFRQTHITHGLEMKILHFQANALMNEVYARKQFTQEQKLNELHKKNINPYL